MYLSSKMVRRIALGAVAYLAIFSLVTPARAQVRQQMADKVAVNAAHQLVTKINGQSCSDFAGMMSQMKQGGSGSSSSGMSSKLKGNSQARTDFVNIVAGPLLNKMIDCNMMPGGM